MADYAAYLLVHPERWVLNDPDVIASEHSDEVCEVVGNFEAAYAREVLAQGARAQRRLVVLDPFDVDSLADDAYELDDAFDPEADDALSCLEALAARHPGRLEVTAGVSLEGWEMNLGDAFEVAERAVELVSDLPAGSRVLVGGFARHDCVARSVQALRERGLVVEVCPTTALPLEDAGIDRYVAGVATS